AALSKDVPDGDADHCCRQNDGRQPVAFREAPQSNPCGDCSPICNEGVEGEGLRHLDPPYWRARRFADSAVFCRTCGLLDFLHGEPAHAIRPSSTPNRVTPRMSIGMHRLLAPIGVTE